MPFTAGGKTLLPHVTWMLDKVQSVLRIRTDIGFPDVRGSQRR